MTKIWGKKTCSKTWKLWVSRSSCVANDSHRPQACPVLPFTFLCSPGRLTFALGEKWSLRWKRGKDWGEDGEDLPLNIMITTEISPQSHTGPWTLSPPGPQVSPAHYTCSLLLNSLTLHLHTLHFFLLVSHFFLVSLSSFFPLLLIFFPASSRTPPFLLFVFCISSVPSRCCVCMCVIITI